VLLLDEPGAHLDLHHQVGLYQCLETLNRDTGLTIIIVSHDWNLPAQFCSSALLLSEGKVVANGSLEEVIDEDRIESVYGTPVRVGRDDETGRLFVIPRGRRSVEERGEDV
jgi:iron complex transport system ATP-binding protein